MERYIVEGAGNWASVPEQACQHYWREFQKEVRWDPSTLDHDVWNAFLERANNRYTGLMNTWHGAYLQDETFAPGIDGDVWQSLLCYWNRPEVKAKSEQCRKNRLSEPGGEGSGIESATGLPPNTFDIAMSIHGPRGEDGTYTYKKMENILTAVEQEAAQLSQQQHASSTDENTDGEPPTQVVDKSELYLKIAGKKKGRIVGLGNYGKIWKTMPSGPGSTSSGITYATSADMDARVAEVREQLEREREEARLREQKLHEEALAREQHIREEALAREQKIKEELDSQRRRMQQFEEMFRQFTQGGGGGLGGSGSGSGSNLP